MTQTITMKFKCTWLRDGHDTLTIWHGVVVPSVDSAVKLSGVQYMVVRHEWEGPYLVHVYISSV